MTGPLRRLNTKYALLFAVVLLIVTLVVLSLAGFLVFQRTNELRAELIESFSIVQDANDVEALRNSGDYLSNRLFNPLYDLDISALNDEIAQIESWLRPRSILLLDTAGRVVSDGTLENPAYGTAIELPPGLRAGEPLIEPVAGGTLLYFVIGYGDELAGYSRVDLSDARKRGLIDALGGRVQEAWRGYVQGFLGTAVLSIGLIFGVSVLLGWWLSTSLSRPLREMIGAAEHFAAGDLGHKLPERSRDELGRLARALNKMAHDLRTAGRLLDRAQEMATFGSWEWCCGDSALLLSHGVYQALGVEARSFAPTVQNLLAFVVPEAQERVFAILQGRYQEPVSAEFAIRRVDGESRTLFIQGEPTRDAAGGVVGFLGTIQDITERQRSNEQLQYLANYDSLTGLPNRNLFYDRLNQAIKKARRRDNEVALLFLDLDRFKSINDALGHDVGDELLRHVARRLQGVVRESDTLARMGGDEFTLIVDDITEEFSPQTIAQNLIEALTSAFVIAGREMFISTSIGIALYPKDAGNLDGLIKNADTAMYLAKEQGKAVFRFFTPELDRLAHERLTLEHQLRQAVDRHAFELYYQPQVRSAGGDLVALETLLRWRLDGALQSAARFVPVLEETGLITRLTGWVLDESCRALAHLQGLGLHGLRICVNLSAGQFQQADLLDLIDAALVQHGLRPHQLELEITESTLLDRELSQRNAERVAERGVRLAIDDFGTGYSSLTYLKRFDVDALKIDRSFIRDLCSDPEDAQITATLIGLAHSLGIDCVAEGVEETAQLERLRDAGCDLVQGYLVCRPVPIAELKDWVHAQDPLDSGCRWYETA